MSTPMTDVALMEQADRDFCAGRLESALAAYVVLLRADPADAYVWYRTSLVLTRVGERERGLEALKQAWEALTEGGQLLLAVAAAEDVAQLDAAAARGMIERLAALYGKGSSRVDRGRRAPPPAPHALNEDAFVGAAGLVELRDVALDACSAAESHWAQHAGSSLPLPFHPLLGDLSPSAFVELVPLMRSRALPAGHVVIEQGAEGLSMFVIARGTVEVSRDGEHLAYLRTGSFFGEMALLTHSPRVARVSCTTPVLLFECGGDSLERLAESTPEVAGVLARHTRQRLLRNLMATSPLFRPLSSEQRAGLIELFTTRVIEPGETVIAEGDDPDGLHVVLTGHCEVVKQEGGDRLRIAELGPGDLFGEISLLQRKPATASVVASRRAVILGLPREAFNARAADFPQALAHVYKVALAREEANKRLQEALHIDVDQEQEILF